jgi:hypothetical protein
MQVPVETSTYMFVQVSIGVVSAACYFQGRISGLRDGINTFES